MRKRRGGPDPKASAKSEKRRIGPAVSPTVERADDNAQARPRTDRLSLIPLKLLRFTAVRERTGLSRSTVWLLERSGAFPKHIRISANIVAWLEEDVVEWIRGRASGILA